MARKSLPQQPPAPEPSPRSGWKQWVVLAVLLGGMYAWRAYTRSVRITRPSATARSTRSSRTAKSRRSPFEDRPPPDI